MPLGYRSGSAGFVVTRYPVVLAQSIFCPRQTEWTRLTGCPAIYDDVGVELMLRAPRRRWHRSHKGPSEYILAHLDDDVKRETKLFPRLPKFQPCATHHLRHPPSSTPLTDPITTSVTQMSLTCPSTVPHLSLTCPSSSPRLNPTSTPNTPHLSQSQARTNSFTRSSPSPRLDQEQPHRPLACISLSPVDSTPLHITCISYRYSPVCN